MEQEQIGNDMPQTENSHTPTGFTGEPIESNYKIIEELKNNSDGNTLLVASKDTGDFFILKHVYATGLPYEKLASFADPALPQVIYAKENTAFGVTTVIEEYLTGITLNEWIKQRELEPISDELAKMVFTQLSGGLKTLHENGIMHRNISPQNIMFMAGQVKFIGFDHAAEGKTYDDVPLYKGMVGFAPPEQAVMGKTDFRSDVYSLGMTMQSLLGADYKGKYAKVLEHCLSSVPDERYRDGKQLQKAVKNAGSISLIKIAALCAASYIIILGGIWLTNHFYNPLQQMLAQRAFENEQKEAEAAAADLQLEKGLNGAVSADGAQTDNGASAMAKGKLSLAVAFPNKPQEENAGVTIVHMGKAADFASAGAASGKNRLFFPDNAKIVLSIKNNTDSDIKNPVIKVIPYNIDLSGVNDPPNTITKHLAAAVEYHRDVSIPAGGDMEFTVPLNKAVFLYPSGQNSALKIVLHSDNYADTAAKVAFDFN
ncbi:protein kinase domain-containing protein [Pectinatus cerevisiiphilus]|uniref:Protein kinase-like protein n=1 Tax=Pectinatus cerevisiiphilus TaxID=86956 RepID=A0A4R3K5X9_9FIRM|nr:protein kinase [Pectinatus cerevisiiphilus]TCS78193.1 protein kinase-like protein [Pectinatus cerevisiiphilus]